jgi:hypothetical protein
MYIQRQKNLNVEYSELLGVDKKDTDCVFSVTAFTSWQKKKGQSTWVHMLLSVQYNQRAIGKYANGLLAINVPYKEPLDRGERVRLIDYCRKELRNRE